MAKMRLYTCGFWFQTQRHCHLTVVKWIGISEPLHRQWIRHLGLKRLLKCPCVHKCAYIPVVSVSPRCNMWKWLIHDKIHTNSRKEFSTPLSFIGDWSPRRQSHFSPTLISSDLVFPLLEDEFQISATSIMKIPWNRKLKQEFTLCGLGCTWVELR